MDSTIPLAPEETLSLQSLSAGLEPESPLTVGGVLMSQNAGPTWDLTSEFRDLEDSKIRVLKDRFQLLLAEIKTEVVPFAQWLRSEKGTGRPIGLTIPDLSSDLVDLVAAILKKRDETKTIIHDIVTYCSCLLSVDGTLEAPKKGLGEWDALDAQLNIALKPLVLWLTLGDESDIKVLKENHATQAESFAIEKLRKRQHQTLSLDQEALLEELEIHGPLAFGRLYDDLTGVLSCQVENHDGTPETIGLAEAANRLMGPDEGQRRQTYQAIDKTFRAHEQSFAAIINHITGWRQSVLKARSTKKTQHYLDPALHQAQISPKTLEAMLHAVEAARPLGQKALRLQAKLLNKKVLDPWDLMAPCPGGGTDDVEIGFAEGIRKIEDSFGQLSPSMKAFVTMMVEKKWIDASVGPNKRPGAYCTQFMGSREPRVYMTYSGSLTNLSTLAHELGHAMHFWLMRDLPWIELDYPMTLAETASIFAESLLFDDLVRNYQDRPRQLLSLLWEGAGDAATFLLNIPARFAMESQFHEHRQKSLLTPEDLRQITDRTWRHWYGPSLSQPNTMFWATKLHFSIGSMSFYNFPYTFGYLFSLSVFSRRAEFGKDFYNRYRALLRDTGRMTAEQVAHKHLGEDLADPKFWQKALEIVKGRVDQFEAAAAKIF